MHLPHLGVQPDVGWHLHNGGETVKVVARPWRSDRGTKEASWSQPQMPEEKLCPSPEPQLRDQRAWLPGTTEEVFVHEADSKAPREVIAGKTAQIKCILGGSYSYPP